MHGAYCKSSVLFNKRFNARSHRHNESFFSSLWEDDVLLLCNSNTSSTTWHLPTDPIHKWSGNITFENTSSLYPNSSPPSFPDTTQLWAGGRLLAMDLTSCCPLSCKPHSPPLYIIKMHWYVRTTLDVCETYMGQHRAYIWSAAKSMRICENRNIPRQNRATYKINPGVQRKGERSQNTWDQSQACWGASHERCALTTIP